MSDKITSITTPEEFIITPFIQNKTHGMVSLDYFVRRYCCFGTNWGVKPTVKEVNEYLENADIELLNSLTKDILLKIKTFFKARKRLEKALWTPLTSHLVSQFDVRTKRFKELVTRIYNLATQSIIE
jgi:hypothetical protein